MKLIDMKVNEYLDVLKSDAPAPGGGSVSALSGAQGVGLFMMVADLTIGKEKYADFEETCRAAKEKGAALYEELTAAVDKDTDAFNLVSAAFKLPKDTDEAKAARSKAIADATLVATEVPFRTMTLCCEGLKAAGSICGKSNPNAASDLGVSALQLLAGVRGAWLNVKINLSGVKDAEKQAHFQAEGERMAAEAEEIANKIYSEILAQL